jgi:hypothetical protein
VGHLLAPQKEWIAGQTHASKHYSPGLIEFIMEMLTKGASVVHYGTRSARSRGHFRKDFE